MPDGIQLTGGSSWYLLHRSFVKFIVECLDTFDGSFGATAQNSECGLVTHLLDYAQYKLSFEELFFQTLASMSSFCKQYENRDLRHINWEKNKRQAQQSGCMHLEEVDWCGNSPQWMLADEYQKGAGKRGEDRRFFARKFRDPAAFDAADRHLGLDSKGNMPTHLHTAMKKDEAASREGGRILASNNVARNRPVEVTSMQKDKDNAFISRHLVDGDLSTRWSSAFSDDQNVKVSLVDTKSAWCNVSEVRVHWESAFATEYQINVKLFATGEWVTVVHDRRSRAKMGSQLMHVHNMALLADTSRIQALQVTGIKRSSRWGYSIWELEVLGECTGAATSTSADEQNTAAGSRDSAATDLGSTEARATNNVAAALADAPL